MKDAGILLDWRVGPRCGSHDRKARRVGMLLATCGLVVPAAATAQAATEPASGSAVLAEMQDAPAGGDIIVTAQRRAERLQDIPISITAESGDSLSDRKVESLIDLGASVPNVNISERRSIGVVTIRGIGYEILRAGAEPGVAVHVDNVYISRPAASLSGFFDVDRLEVARGPQGTLYGRNATGGAVNIITRRPTDEFSGYLNATYGNYDALRVEGAVSGPIIGNVLKARIAFKRDRRDGYRENLFDGSDINNLNTHAVRGILEFTPSDDFTLIARGDYFRARDRNFVPVFGGYYRPCDFTVGQRRCAIAYGGQSGIGDPDLAVNYDYPSRNHQTFKGVSLTAEAKLGGVTFRSITAYRDQDYDFAYDLDGTDFNQAFIGRGEDSHQLSQELQFTGDSGALQWLVGGFFFQEASNAMASSADLLIPDFNTALKVRQYGRLETESYAIFAQASYNVTDRLKLTLGGRYTTEDKRIEGEYSQTSFTVMPPADPPRSASFSNFSPKVTVDLKVTDDVLLYANVQRGFKSGGFAAGARTPAFEPEKITSYEAGLKSTWFDRRLRVNASVFHYDYTNLQVEAAAPPPAPPGSRVTNAGKSRVRGGELEVNARPTDWLTLAGNLAILDAKYTDYQTIDADRVNLGLLQLSGNRLALAPKITYTLAAQVDAPVGDGKMSARAEYQYTSSVFFNAFNVPQLREGPFDTVNMFLNYEQGPWKAGVFARNLFNEVYATGASVSIALVNTPIAYNYAPPRTYGVNLGIKF